MGSTRCLPSPTSQGLSRGLCFVLIYTDDGSDISLDAGHCGITIIRHWQNSQVAKRCEPKHKHEHKREHEREHEYAPLIASQKGKHAAPQRRMEFVKNSKFSYILYTAAYTPFVVSYHI
jgi:hypothetical protein